MAWRFAYNAACEADGVALRAELVAHDELDALVLNGNCPERFTSRIGDKELAVLCKALSSVSTVVEVDLSYNDISDAGALAFADLLRRNTSIQFVLLAHNQIGPDGARAIADALMLNVTVVSLSLRGNPIDDDGGSAIGTMIRGNNALVSLDLGSCGLAIRALVGVVQALAAHPALCSVNLDKPLLRGAHDTQCVIQHLSATISRTTVIVELSLAHWGLHDDLLGLLLPALVQNSSITRLSLAGNKLSFGGGALLARLLTRRPDMTVLDVSSNNIGDKGVAAISDATRGHPSLSRLLLHGNGAGERGLTAVAHALPAALSLQELTLWGNVFTEAAAAAFQQVWHRAEQLRYLDFSLYSVDGQVMVSRNED